MKNGEQYELIFAGQIDEDIKLLQLPSQDFIDKFANKGSVMIKAPNNTNEAVLCDKSNTYSIKMAETSNTNLLIPIAKEGSNKKLVVQSKLFSVLEIQKIKPSFQHLQTLLSKSLYEGKEFESEKTNMYKFEDLRQEIQASDTELLDHLKAIGAIEIEGYWRLMKPSYYDEIFRMILDISSGNELSPSTLTVEDIYDNMQSYEDFLIKQQRKTKRENNFWCISQNRLFQRLQGNLLSLNFVALVTYDYNIQSKVQAIV